MNLDEIIAKLAAMGLPAVILLITMANTGLAGAAAITTALATLGLGPGGMIGGLALLGIVALAGDALTKYGLESLLKGIYQYRLSNGESLDELSKEIGGLPISKELKLVLKDELDRVKSLIGRYQKRRSNGEPVEELCNEIDELPISNELKSILKNNLGCQEK